MATLSATRDTAKTVKTPYWTRQVVEACNTLCDAVSYRFPSVAVSGVLPAGGDGKRLLHLMLVELAERYDLEVTLDINGTSFVANFRPATP